ncbi:MAG: hypothetical protein ABL879_09060 [Devosia sp.]
MAELSLGFYAALLAAVMFVLLALFQAALAGGSPWGRLAWGGKEPVLPPLLRGASFFAVVLLGFFAVVMAQRTGLVTLLPPSVVDVAIWVIVAYLALGVPMNAISRSLPERLVMTPVAIVLFAAVLIVALGL